jgi:flagellar assembly factor FliW
MKALNEKAENCQSSKELVRLKIHTIRFGKIAVNESEIITFPEGPLGFTRYKQYALLAVDEYTPLKWLQSLEEDWLAFVLLQPCEFLEEYDLLKNPACASEVDRCLGTIGLHSIEEAEIYVIVTAAEKPEEATANLQAPILLNPNRRMARQVILMSSGYAIRYPILNPK